MLKICMLCNELCVMSYYSFHTIQKNNHNGKKINTMCPFNMYKQHKNKFKAERINVANLYI